MYQRTFQWVADRINESLSASKADIKAVIGVLDIYGFEIFENNSFEQFCINYCNESLQQLFIELTLKTEQDEYSQAQMITDYRFSKSCQTSCFEMWREGAKHLALRCGVLVYRGHALRCGVKVQKVQNTCRIRIKTVYPIPFMVNFNFSGMWPRASSGHRSSTSTTRSSVI